MRLRGAAAAAALSMACRAGDGGAGAREVDVRALFLEHCAQCHGEHGRGLPELAARIGPIRDLTDRAWQDTVSDRHIAETILSGRNKMPGFRGVLTPLKAAAIAAHVRSLAGGAR